MGRDPGQGAGEPGALSRGRPGVPACLSQQQRLSGSWLCILPPLLPVPPPPLFLLLVTAGWLRPTRGHEFPVKGEAELCSEPCVRPQPLLKALLLCRLRAGRALGKGAPEEQGQLWEAG